MTVWTGTQTRMERKHTRKLTSFKKHTVIITLMLLCLLNASGIAQEPISVPFVDLHVHLSDSLTVQEAVQLSQQKGVRFGIVEHPGVCEYCPLQNDSLLTVYINKLRNYPVYVGLQPVIPGWRKLFSPRLLNKLDYIIMDAMEIPQENGDILRIWMDDTRVEDLDAFMDMYVNYHLQILRNERIDILANATFLPKCLEGEYERAWTKERMQKVIDAAVENNVAFEINSGYKVPSKEFILLARASGAKFSFGTNSRNSFAGNLEYALSMVQQCHLSRQDIFVPGDN